MLKASEFCDDKLGVSNEPTKLFRYIPLLLWLAIAANTGCSIQGDVIVTGSSIDRSTSLYFRTEPATQVAGQAFTTAPVVEVRDDQGSLVTNSSKVVTLAMTSGSGSLAGTTSVAAVRGVATFSNLSISDVDASVVLTASNPSATSASTSSFVVGYGPVAIGQADLSNNYNMATSLNSPWTAMSDGSKLFVADSGNNRVLIWNSVPTSNRQADIVLGHTNTTGASSASGITAKGLKTPSQVYADGAKIAIADTGNNRVLIWNSYPTSSYAAADIVLGQPDMNSNTANNGGVSAQSMSSPRCVFWVGSKFFVVDFNNSRVLIWNSFPTTNGQAADVVLGQPDMISSTANNGGISAQSLQYPMGVHSDGTKLVVADRENDRVLIWNTIPTVNGQAADLVLGAPNMTTDGYGITAQNFVYPASAQIVGSKLLVADWESSRVLIWNTFPTVNQQAADVVLGQPNMTSSTANNGGISAQTLSRPGGAYSAGGKLYVADFINSRVLIWNSIPTVTQTAADIVIGQTGFGSSVANGSQSLQSSFSSPGGIYSSTNRFVVADTANNRVLIWNKPPATNSIPADIVLGQPNMTTNTANNGGVSAQSLSSPQSVCSDGTKLLVIDKNNNRVLIWNTWPTTNQQAADLELGQPDMVSSTFNNGGISAQTLFRPYDCATDGTRLFVADQANLRVLMWNTIPTVNRQAADLVLGQSDMAQRFYLSTLAAGFINPSSVAISGTKVVVADGSDHRVMIWNTIPTVNRQNPDVYLGQADFSTQTLNFGGLSSKSMYLPTTVRVIDGRLYVADQSNNRVLYWNTIPTVTYSAADGVIGQPNFTSNSVNNGGLSSGLNLPAGLASFIFNGITHLLISDTKNDRITLTPL